MAFTYTEDLTVDRDFVRFHTGDTREGESYLSDAIITSLLAIEATKQQAVIAAIKYIIAQLSTPNFRADWLQVDYATARKSYTMLLREKQREFGLNAITSRAQHNYRADGTLSKAPDYDD